MSEIRGRARRLETPSGDTYLRNGDIRISDAEMRISDTEMRDTAGSKRRPAARRAVWPAPVNVRTQEAIAALVLLGCLFVCRPAARRAVTRRVGDTELEKLCKCLQFVLYWRRRAVWPARTTRFRRMPARKRGGARAPVFGRRFSSHARNLHERIRHKFVACRKTSAPAHNMSLQ